MELLKEQICISLMYTTIKKFGVGNIFFMILKVSYAQQKLSVIYFCNIKAEFSASLLQSLVSEGFDIFFRNHSNMLIWCSRNISYSQC